MRRARWKLGRMLNIGFLKEQAFFSPTSSSSLLGQVGPAPWWFLSLFQKYTRPLCKGHFLSQPKTDLKPPNSSFNWTKYPISPEVINSVILKFGLQDPTSPLPNVWPISPYICHPVRVKICCLSPLVPRTPFLVNHQTYHHTITPANCYESPQLPSPVTRFHTGLTSEVSVTRANPHLLPQRYIESNPWSLTSPDSRFRWHRL